MTAQARSGSWSAFAAWTALALVAQVAAFQLVDAGPSMHYQHYRSVSWMAQNAPLSLGIVLVQSVVVLVGLVRQWPRLHSLAGGRVKLWSAVACLALFVATGATVSREIPFYFAELWIAAWIHAAFLGTVVLAVVSAPERAWSGGGSRWLDWMTRSTDHVDRTVIGAAIWVTVLSATLSIFSYERHPHIGDEVAYLYHARYLAKGMLTMPLPQTLEAFNFGLLDWDSTRWYASPPPGWPLILAIGVAFKAAWLVNPVLAGLCVLLTWLVVRDLYDARTARVSALLLAASPWHVLVGMSFMTHSASLACALGAAYGIVRSRNGGGWWWAIASGLLTGMVGFIRPLEGLVIGGLLGLWVIGAGGKRLTFPAIMAWGIGCMAVGVAIGFYNYAITGHATTFPIMAWADRFMGVNSNAMGFGPDRGMGWQLDPYPGHSILEAAINANLNITALNTELFGWGAGSLLLLFLRFFVRPWRRPDTLMLVSAAAVFVAHSFYWFSGGPDFAARYWYLMIVPLVVLSASGLTTLLADGAGRVGAPVGKHVALAVLVMTIIANVAFIPWRAIDKYHHYLGMRTEARTLSATLPRRSLVLVRGKHASDFASAATYNPIDLVNDDAPVFAWDGGAYLRAQLLPQYSDRSIFIAEGSALTGAGLRIVEGPLTARAILDRDSVSAATNSWTPPYAERLPPSMAPIYTRPLQR